MRSMSSWGRLSSLPHDVVALTDRGQVSAVLKQNHPGIAYGMGRSYGDACLNDGGRLWHVRYLDRFIEFDESTGRVCCEAGVLLRDIQRMMVPRGWMLPVTPGTQLVTVGGAIANDVHGKNHHVMGSFGDHVLALTLARSDGTVMECRMDSEPGMFAATIGGVGLTGVIVAAQLQLRRIEGPWLHAETLPYRSLDEFFAYSDDSEAEWEHTVSWIDCVAGGRGLFMRANPAESLDKPPPLQRSMGMPIVPPVSLVNALSLRLFNMAYFNLKSHGLAQSVVHYEPFSYPLDHVENWNRMYGPKGFYQYQSVVPREQGQEVIQAMLDEIARAGEGSFLAVLKTFGDRKAPGMLSFPRPGVTLALDFPNRGERTLRLFASLNDIVREAGGRIYLAKDACMPRDLFESGYPRLKEFLAFRDPGISSAMSRRLMGS